MHPTLIVISVKKICNFLIFRSEKDLDDLTDEHLAEYDDLFALASKLKTNILSVSPRLFELLIG